MLSASDFSRLGLETEMTENDFDLMNLAWKMTRRRVSSTVITATACGIEEYCQPAGWSGDF